MKEDGKGHYINSYALLTNHLKYAELLDNDLDANNEIWDKYRNPTSHDAGHFIELSLFSNMVSDDFVVNVHMEQSHFEELDASTIKKILNRMKKIDNNIISISEVSKDRKATIKISKIETTEDIGQFVDSLNYLLSVVTVLL